MGVNAWSVIGCWLLLIFVDHLINGLVWQGR
jgi:hypothetical protein